MVNCGLRFPAVAGPDSRSLSGFPRPTRRAAAALLALVPVLAGLAQSPGTPSLLSQPEPRFKRPLSTDRPDQTESPYTVEAGRFQVEMDFLSLTLDTPRDGGVPQRTEDWNVSPLNLKAGLLPNVDVQFLVAPQTWVRSRDLTTGDVTRTSGPGDLLTRLKFNVWGNDGGKTALAIMPYVKWPLPESALRNGRTEGGIIVPFGLELPAPWGLGAMTQVDFVANDRGGHDTEFFNTVTLGRDLTKRLAIYVEAAVTAGTAPGFRWQGQLDVGWTYAIGENTQFDIGCNFGVTRSAPDYQPFAGLSFRF